MSHIPLTRKSLVALGRHREGPRRRAREELPEGPAESQNPHKCVKTQWRARHPGVALHELSAASCPLSAENAAKCVAVLATVESSELAESLAESRNPIKYVEKSVESPTSRRGSPRALREIFPHLRRKRCKTRGILAQRGELAENSWRARRRARGRNTCKNRRRARHPVLKIESYLIRGCQR